MFVIDSLGIGALPDADKYNDTGADTLGHIVEALGNKFTLPNLEKLGLFNLLESSRAYPLSQVTGSYCKMSCVSPAKDSTAGHWELAGLVLKEPFPTYPDGFPREIIDEFEKRIGTKTLGNYSASGTKIIEKLGSQHVETKYPIVYTSADSVFQVAAHEDVFGLERLYEACRIARKMLTGKHAVGRVIARPFVGERGSFTRTENRRDLSLSPFGPTILDRVKDSGGDVIAIGKISDLFNGQGITKEVHTSCDEEGMEVTLKEVSSAPGNTEKPALIFSNLVDFDTLWGHRRDVGSYAKGLKDFDDYLPSLAAKLRDEDVLIITADHGCDPTYTKHTDHTREYVPLLAYGKSIKPGNYFGLRDTFSDLAQTIADVFGLPAMDFGKSFKEEIEGHVTNF